MIRLVADGKENMLRPRGGGSRRGVHKTTDVNRWLISSVIYKTVANWGCDYYVGRGGRT